MDPQALLIGGIIGVVPALIVAFVTAYLNQKAFRDELGASEFVEHQIKLYQEFWFELSKINLDFEQFVAEPDLYGGNPQKIERLFKEKFIPIRIKFFQLDKYYILLPDDAITQLNNLKDVLVKGPQENRSMRDIFKDYKTVYQNLFKIIRNIQGKIVSRETSISSILADNPDVTFPMIRDMLK